MYMMYKYIEYRKLLDYQEIHETETITHINEMKRKLAEQADATSVSQMRNDSIC